MAHHKKAPLPWPRANIPRIKWARQSSLRVARVEVAAPREVLTLALREAAWCGRQKGMTLYVECGMAYQRLVQNEWNTNLKHAAQWLLRAPRDAGIHVPCPPWPRANMPRYIGSQQTNLSTRAHGSHLGLYPAHVVLEVPWYLPTATKHNLAGAKPAQSRRSQSN